MTEDAQSAIEWLEEHYDELLEVRTIAYDADFDVVTTTDRVWDTDLRGHRTHGRGGSGLMLSLKYDDMDYRHLYAISLTGGLSEPSDAHLTAHP